MHKTKCIQASKQHTHVAVLSSVCLFVCVHASYDITQTLWLSIFLSLSPCSHRFNLFHASSHSFFSISFHVSLYLSQQRSIFASRFDKLVRKYIPEGEITRPFCWNRVLGVRLTGFKWFAPWKRIWFSYFAPKLFYLQGINNVYFKCCFHCCYYCCFEFHLHSRFNWDISADECQMRSFCNKANSLFFNAAAPADLMELFLQSTRNNEDEKQNKTKKIRVQMNKHTSRISK